jgi:molecular chaperone GrpE
MTQDASDTPNDTSPLFSDNTVTEETPSIGQQDGSNPPQDDEITKLKGEIGQLREQLARSQADYNNLVRRSREESSQIGEWSENKTILKFLPILDNLERALEHTPEEFK